MENESKKEKFIKFCVKYKVNFLFLVLGLFLLNGIFYEVTQLMPLENHHLFMEIDDKIPFIPEFCFFYTLFYVCPTVFLSGLAFYDKKKLMAIIVDGTISVTLCFIVYLIFNVQMRRTPYEELVANYWFFDGSVTNTHEFFMALLHFQYVVDPMARNGIPSLHAMFGGLIFLCGCPFSNKEKHVPIVFRILAIVFGLGVICSTFFVKQHYFIDAVIGFALAVVMFFVSKIIVKKIIEKYPENHTIKLLTDDDYER